jgi:ATP-dependent Clp protease adapter protein ClpS
VTPTTFDFSVVSSEHHHTSKLDLKYSKIDLKSNTSIGNYNMKLLLLFLLSYLHLTCAFAPAVFGVRSPSAALFAGKGESEGGAAIAKPAIKVDQKTETKVKEKVQQQSKVRTYDPISRRDDEFEEAPMFKLMLLGDDSYDPSHVIERICAVVQDMDEDQASSVLQQANRVGKAMCGKYPFEMAELYKEQLIRSDPMIFSDIEEENK